MEMIDFYIPYKDRGIDRLDLCIDYLDHPVVNSITVIDYSSSIPLETSRVNVIRVNDKPIWNKSHALNVGIKDCGTEYFGTVDCDTLMNGDYLDEVQKDLSTNKFFCSSVVKQLYVYDKLPYGELVKASRFWLDNPKYKLAIGAIQIIPMWFLNKYRGYNESLCYWNGVDYYMYLMAIKHGLDITQYDIPILHLEHELRKTDICKDAREKVVANIIVKNRKTVVKELVEGNITNGESWGQLN